MKIKKSFIVSALLIPALLLSGCAFARFVADDPLSDEEVIAYAQEQIYKETGDEVTAEITAKETLMVPTLYIDGGGAYRSVKGAHEYDLKITSKEYSGLVATAFYKDGYILYDQNYPGGTAVEPTFHDNYKERKNFYYLKKEFEEALNERFDDYRIYDDVSEYYGEGLDIFICSTDCDRINDLLSKFEDIVFKYNPENFEFVPFDYYNVYVYKDKQVFNSTDFEKYKDAKPDSDDHSSIDFYSIAKTIFKVLVLGESTYSSDPVVADEADEADEVDLTTGEDMIGSYTGKEVVQVAMCDPSYTSYINDNFFTSDGVSHAEEKNDEVDRDSLEYYVFRYRACPNLYEKTMYSEVCLYGVK